MTNLKRKISKLLSLIVFIITVYKTIDFIYYFSFAGNDDIHFVDFQGTEKFDYNELFKIEELSNKYIYATLNNRADWKSNHEDILAMDTLFQRFHNDNLVFLYTADDIDGITNKYEWKKLIRKYKLRGYHINLPRGYEWNLQESRRTDSSTITSFPKYMIISNNGIIIDKWATRPRKTAKLISELDSLININHK